MPELPEVETIVSDLRPLLTGLKFADLKWTYKNYGKGGKNQEVLFVYGRGGKPCRRCKNTLTKVCRLK